MPRLRLGFRHTLHAVRAGLELELGVDVVALDAGDDLLVTAVLAFVLRQDFQAPAALFGVTRVHAEQVAGEDGGLVTAGPGADFQKHVAPVIGVFGQQHALQLRLQGKQLFLGLAHFLHGHFAQVRVAVLEQRLGALQVVLHLAPGAVGDEHRLDFGVLTGIGAKASLVGNDLGIAQQGGEFFEAVLENLQFFQQRRFHCGVLSVAPS